MSGEAEARIQLCGRFVVDIDGSRIEDTLPGRRGRVLFAYLVLNRGRPLPRDQLLMAGWGDDAPAEAGNALSVLLSKLRHGLGADHLRGRTRDRAAAAAGDLRRRRGGPGGRPPGGVLHRRGTVGAGVGPGRDRLPRRHQAVPRRAGGALDRRVAAPAGGGPAARAGVLCRRRPRPRRPGAGASRGTRQDADRARALPRDRAPHPHGSARAARQRRRSAPRLRAATSPAPRGARDRAQPRRTGRPPTAAATAPTARAARPARGCLRGSRCQPARGATRPCGLARSSRARRRRRPG